MAFAKEHRRLLHGKSQILIRHHGLRHAGERCELIDHAFDLAGLTLDRLRQRFKQLTVFGHLLAELLAQPLG